MDIFAEVIYTTIYRKPRQGSDRSQGNQDAPPYVDLRAEETSYPNSVYLFFTIYSYFYFSFSEFCRQNLVIFRPFNTDHKC